MSDPELVIDMGTTERAHAFMDWFFDHVDCDDPNVDMSGSSTGSVVTIEFSGLDLL